jgi:hypothetical protein
MNVNAQLEVASYNAVHSIMALWEAITYKTFMKLTTKKFFNVTATYNVSWFYQKKFLQLVWQQARLLTDNLNHQMIGCTVISHVRARTGFVTLWRVHFTY